MPSCPNSNPTRYVARSCTAHPRRSWTWTRCTRSTADPTGLFVLAYSPSGDPIACGGYRAYREQTGVVEVRKMYVDPGSRRLGLSRRVLEELEDHAAGSGAARMILENRTCP
ncbi:GNAT family N-acetyltransferase [Nocardia abscessus]|uniref:GNAT family N-acetyltransferase n=1 Tax=Nocardia abscessus TaxID=120957 RepID=UPI003CC7E14B